MSRTNVSAKLDPADPASWTLIPYDELLAIPLDEVQAAQEAVLIRRFEELRPRLEALDKLATRQGIDRIDSIESAIPVFFDHRVLKSYPMSLIENGNYDRLTAWMQRLTTNDLSQIPLDGVDSLDSWIDQLDAHGMLVGHSTGTTGKLSFIPRSQAEWPAWHRAYFELVRSVTGVDFREEQVPTFTTGYRKGHQMAVKLQYLFAQASAGGDENRHALFDHAISSDLLSLMGRMRLAEARGELDQLEIDPALLEKRDHLIEANRTRDQDLEEWFTRLAEEYRGQRVRISGLFSELARLAVQGLDRGFRCEFAPDSIVLAGGGLKGYDAPPDWRERVHEFLGIDRLHASYGMSEAMANARWCEGGSYHIFPYVAPIVLDEDFAPLPRKGKQTGRMALFDVLAETYWGGFISGDRVTVHWDEECGCGWPNPRVEPDIVRFSQLTGDQDDKITCAGTAQAYSDFMDYVSTI